MRIAEVDHAEATPRGFGVHAAGMTADAGVLLLCSGMRYEPPPLEGLAELWPRRAYHCPYCHGWEVRDRPLAVYRSNAAHLALMLASLSDDVVLLTDGSSDIDPDELQLLRSAGVAIRDDPVTRVEITGDEQVRVVFANGSSDDRAGFFLVPTTTPSALVASLGCEVDDSGGILIDADGRTSVPGVFAAGDTTNDRKAVVLAAAGGSRAAYAINAALARGALPVRG
jgi:thioredoxin reductase